MNTLRFLKKIYPKIQDRLDLVEQEKLSSFIDRLDKAEKIIDTSVSAYTPEHGAAWELFLLLNNSEFGPTAFFKEAADASGLRWVVPRLEFRVKEAWKNALENSGEVMKTWTLASIAYEMIAYASELENEEVEDVVAILREILPENEEGELV